LPKRLLVGRALRSEQLGETLLPKSIALPVFCSDPLSSNAYATEEILLALSLGGLALFHLAWWVAGAVILLLIVVVASYRQTCYGYPNGGGAYAVSRANLGSNASLVAASALLVDYVLTVAVSVVAGVANVVSAFPAIAHHAVPVSIAVVVVLATMNLRGIKESGTIFAVPTYAFIGAVFLMLTWGLVRFLGPHHPVAESASFGIEPTTHAGGLLLVALVLRSFAQGCTSLTGTEAVSNGVPNFRPPKSRNAANTLAIMGGLTISMFAGITALALTTHVRIAEDTGNLIGAPDGYHQRTVIAQVGRAVFGEHSPLFYLVQFATAAVLMLAANTAFNGFPILGSILGEDGYLPRQFARRGDRLVFSNGVVLLSILSCVLIWAFGASTDRLIQLYIIGVFVSFTLSQAGMVRHWNRLLPTAPPGGRRRMVRSRAINAVGAVFTAVVLVIVLLTKFVHGAWIVAIAMPTLFVLMKAIHRHYAAVAIELAPDPAGMTLPSRIHAVVLVSRLHKPTLRALAFARAIRPHSLVAVTASTNQEETQRLMDEWSRLEIPVPLTVLGAPYRDLTRPVLSYIRDIRRDSPRDLVCVFVPEYVVGHWWEHLLHNQSALRLKARLLFQPGVIVANVPWQLGSAARLEEQPNGADAQVAAALAGAGRPVPPG
jgi:amino acid transporter